MKAGRIVLLRMEYRTASGRVKASADVLARETKTQFVIEEWVVVRQVSDVYGNRIGATVRGGGSGRFWKNTGREVGVLLSPGWRVVEAP